MYAIVDIETTGGHASSNGITEIAIYHFDGFDVTGKYTTLINPECTIPSFVVNLTGISQSMVEGEKPFREKAAEIYQHLKGRIFVAHNVNFDYSFLKHHLAESGFVLNEKKLCTVRLARQVIPGMVSYSLGKLSHALGIEIQGRHRAAGDALATVKLLGMILDRGGKATIDKMLKRSSGDQWLPMHLDKSAIDALPDDTGVYYFKNAKNKIIYVGKALNIRRRVIGHFTQNDPDRKRQYLLKHVHSISYQACANELHALILESTEIRKWWPICNRSQKFQEKKFGLYSYVDGKGYLRLALDQKKKNLPAHYSFHLLHEGQVLLRKMAEEYALDFQLCHLGVRLETTSTHSLPPVQEYNSRVEKAIQSLNSKLPSFAIVEKMPQQKQHLYLLVDKGAFWGMGYVDDHLQPSTTEDLKQWLEPYRDNDFIRNSLYHFAEAHPHATISFQN